MSQVTVLHAQVRRPRRLLDLDYAPRVPPDVLQGLEAQGRRMGLPLEQLELLGQDVHTARAFVAACAAGDAVGFLAEHVDWGMLRRALRVRSPVRN